MLGFPSKDTLDSLDVYGYEKGKGLFQLVARFLASERRSGNWLLGRAAALACGQIPSS